LKKCTTVLGVGLYLYNGEMSLHERNDRTGTPKSAPPTSQAQKEVLECPD
jgi:hypothetical protein